MFSCDAFSTLHDTTDMTELSFAKSSETSGNSTASQFEEQINESTTFVVVPDETITSEIILEQELEPYIKPNLISWEEFDFGDYFWVVLPTNTIYQSAGNLFDYKYSILGENISSINNGLKIFEKIQNKYYKKYDIPNRVYDINNTDWDAEIKKILSERQVLNISADGKRVLCLSYQYRDDQRDYYEYWDQLYEIYENDTLIKSVLFEKKEYNDFYADDFRATSYLNGYFITTYSTLEKESETTYMNFEKGMEVHLGNIPYLKNLDKTTYLSEDHNQNTYKIYSLEDGSLIKEYTLKENRKIVCYTGDKILLTEKDKKIRSEDSNIDCVFYNEGKVYIADVNGSNELYLGSYMFNPVLSSDGKYLAYESYSEEEWISEFCKNDMLSGYYIKNLDTGDTVYYECNIFTKEIKGFIKKNGFEKLIGTIEWVFEEGN